MQKKKKLQKYDHLSRNGIFRFLWMNQEITDSHKSYLVETYPQLRTLMSCIREFREIFQRKSMPCLYLFIEKYKNSYKIIYNCTKCHQKHKNIMATDDDFNIIIKLSNEVNH